MELLLCPRCGENLVKENDLFRCPCCDALVEGDTAEKATYLLQSILDQDRIQRLSTAKRLLWDAAHEKYPSQERVCDAAKAVLLIRDDDFLANVYLHSHDRDPSRLCLILARANVSKAEAEECYRWLLPSLSLRLVGALHDFVDRHFANEERISRINELEDEAHRISQGIYEPSAMRDVFLCYSSLDMPRVIEIMNVLEQNGFACFAAFRNLRHGKGAQENYLSAIKEAMCSCETVVFLSSHASRSIDCDALKVELPFLANELPNKRRIEYLLEDYDDDTPYLVRKTLKKAFPEQERCVDIEDLIDRIASAPEKALPPETEAKPEPEPEPKPEPALPKEAPAPLEIRGEDNLRIEGESVYFGQYPGEWNFGVLLDTEIDKASKDYRGYVLHEGETYYYYNKTWFKVMPIHWIILEKGVNELLLMSREIVDIHKFDSYSADYDKSEIRAWLNGEFLRNAFPNPSLLLPVDGEDYVTLPRRKQVEGKTYQYASANPTTLSAQKGATVDYVEEKRGFLRKDKFSRNRYWLRDEVQGETLQLQAYCMGPYSVFQEYTTRETIGVRPIIRVKIPK